MAMSDASREPRRYDLSCEVDPYRSGWSLQEFLAHRFRYHPWEVWAQRIEAGDVRVNDRVAAADTVVAAGDRVVYSVLHTEPPVDFNHVVLYEDEHVLAVSKSGNLPVHAGGKFIRNTLIAHLRERWGNELRPAHRLDRETSGVVLLAKSREAARALEREFHARRVAKKYLAVLRGRMQDEVLVDAPIARAAEPGPPYRRIVDPDHGKPARTRFRPLRVEDADLPVAGVAPAALGGELSFVAVSPESGRTNQIRVHAAHVGHPVLGDKIYGVSPALAREFVASGENERVLAAAGAARHLLHCSSLQVAHPADGSPLRLTASLPPDFLPVLAAWRERKEREEGR
jgi:RluA family pseudouridine synthase